MGLTANERFDQDQVVGVEFVVLHVKVVSDDRVRDGVVAPAVVFDGGVDGVHRIPWRSRVRFWGRVGSTRITEVVVRCAPVSFTVQEFARRLSAYRRIREAREAGVIT